MALSINARKKKYIFGIGEKYRAEERGKSSNVKNRRDLLGLWKSPHFQNTHREYRHDGLRSAVNKHYARKSITATDFRGIKSPFASLFTSLIPTIIAQRDNSQQTLRYYLAMPNNFWLSCHAATCRCNSRLYIFKESLTLRSLFPPPFLTMEQRRGPRPVSAHEDWICTNLLVK